MLPQAFLNRMESMLGNEYPAFLESYDKDKYQALRLNSIKGDTAQMKGKSTFFPAADSLGERWILL